MTCDGSPVFEAKAVFPALLRALYAPSCKLSTICTPVLQFVNFARMGKSGRVLPAPKTPAQLWIELQISMGESAEKLGKRLGIDTGTMSNYRSGRRGISRDHLVTLHQVSNLPLEQLALVPGAARRRPGTRSVARQDLRVPVETVPAAEYMAALETSIAGESAEAAQEEARPTYPLTVERIRIAMALNLNPGRQWSEFCKLCAEELAKAPAAVDDYWLDWCQAIREHLGNAKDGSAQAAA